MEKPYVYRKLDAKRHEIRLLDVLPDTAGKPVRVNIRVVQLPAAYETISYAWGNPARSGCIEVRMKRRRRWSRQLRVPANTEAALRRMRYSDRACTIWIDAVCINQDDKMERSQQVAIMGKIFASSFGNLVYLGELEDVDMAARIESTIDKLFTHARKETDDFRTFQSSLWRERQGLPFEVDEDVISFVLNLPWFRRLWVLQEVVMAPRSTAFLGTSRFKIHDMLRALVWWGAHFTSYPSGITQGVRCLHSMEYHLSYRGHARAPPAQLLFNLLITATVFQKSEPRDSVFALLAMMDDRSSSYLSPDYTRSLSETLQSASRLALQESPSILRCIAHRPGDLEQAEVASWAMRADRELDYGLDPTILPPRDYQTYAVSEGRDKAPSELKSSVLKLTVYQADTVNVVTPVCTSSIYGDREAFSTWLWQAIQLYTSVSASSSQEVKAEAFAKTLCADDYYGRRYHELTDEERGPMEDFLATLCSAMTGDILKLLNASEASTPGSYQRTRHRRCLTTRQGRLGLGPRDMKSGDVVALLSGAGFPYILRRLDDGQYQLVGAAYVDGIMPEDLGVEWQGKKGQVFALV
ncbi:hypothetical protein LTS10_007610 [Elasticomyces elasticus]|nr:hypothetical protein LTS10_007610 [Elasticomyces elasticus]